MNAAEAKPRRELSIDDLLASQYLRPTDIQDGDVVEIVSEGRIRSAEESKWGKPSLLLDVQLPSGARKTWSLNVTTLRRLTEAWGKDRRSWVGRRVRLEKVRQNVRGELRDVIYGRPLEERRGEPQPAAAPALPVEEVRSMLRALAAVHERMELSSLEAVLRAAALNVGAEEACRLAGVRVVEEAGRRYAVLREAKA
jgi:hypothetical protein